MRDVHEIGHRPEFEGRILLVEGYDMALARKLVAGVDVWLNNPEYPLEASGTSGQKAGANGVINLSVLDGWWDEGYDGSNGWAITPHGPKTDPAVRDRQEAREMMELLERQVIPLYFKRDGHGYSAEWVKMSKASMKSTIPRFNAQRMVSDYVTGFYGPAARRHRTMVDTNTARELTTWRKKVAATWQSVALRRVDAPLAAITTGEALPIKVAVRLGDLDPQDLVVECLVGKAGSDGKLQVTNRRILAAVDGGEPGEALFALDYRPDNAGLSQYELRCYPSHPLLSHPFETGLMKWL
jgi:starch phosphorylase